MTNSRYIVEYFPEDSDTMESLFVEAASKDEAKSHVVNRCGAFVNIVACNLTKSSGGVGATFQPEAPSVIETEVVEEQPTIASPIVPEDAVETPDKQKEPVTIVTVAPKAKKPVSDSGAVKVPKVTNASRIREQVVAAKAEGITDMQGVIDWAVANLGQTKGMAKAYVKAIWAE